MILDEPTSSLDPLIRNQVFSELRNVIDQGRTVLFSSHSLDEVETLCDEVIILRDGHIVEHQQIDLLKKKALRRIQIVFGSRPVELNGMPADLNIRKLEENVLTGAWTGQIQTLLGWISGYDVTDVTIERPDLNDLFISYYTSGKLEDEKEKRV